MKRLYVALWLLMAVHILGYAQQSHALLIGITNYGDDRLNLLTPAEDVTRLGNFLNNKCGMITQIITNRNATKGQVAESLQKMVMRAKVGDKVFVFVSGHGGVDPDANGWLLMADKQQLYYKEMIEIVLQSPANEFFFFIDACHSGSLMALAYKEQKTWKGKHINFCVACREDETAAESAWINKGFFSMALIKGLRGKADQNGDRKVTLRELHNYVKKDVEERAKREKIVQHPQLICSKKAENVVLVTIQ